MLPTNVMSFMKKMVNTEPGSTLSATGTGSAASDAGTDSGGGTTFGKLKQTLSSGLLTAQDKVVKMTPRPSLIPVDFDPPPPPDPTPTPPPPTTTTAANQPGKPPSRTGACRVCLKAFKPDDFSRTCAECHQRVCEDCASYSKVEKTTVDGGGEGMDGEDGGERSWTCSVCRRKLQSRAAMQQDSSESLLDVPMQQELQRRHSEARLGCSSGGLTPGGLSSGLAPPRSPELRRHSDVSPASLKELEKLKGTPGAPTTCGPGGSDIGGRRGSGRSCASSRANSPPRGPSPGGLMMAEPHPSRSRRGSRVVTRQHSYDDDVKMTSGSTGDMSHVGASTQSTLMSLPAPMPRRASAYDVFTVPALSTVTTLPQAPSSGVPTSRRPSFRGVPCVGGGSGAGGTVAAAAATTAAIGNDTPTTPPSPDLGVSGGLGGGLMVGVDDEVGRRQRRRGSQLPDIAGLRQGAPLQPTQQSDQPMRPQPTLDDLEAAPPRRQASVDAEAIRIVIHDVDSAPGGPGGGAAAQRRVVLRRDPSDKIHRTRGFGMRVVGGKTAPDGRLFAYIVWTVPGGPAERGGLQQGDKVLEWGGVSLIDRSFEEVCAIMDRTGDVVELMVEHATDLRMCDFLDDPTPPQPPSSSSAPGVIVGVIPGQISSGGAPISGVSLPTVMGAGARKTSDGGLHVDSDSVDKTPSSPTRRKLPKTPEQLARERMVTGRVQLQVWYHDERRELVVAVLAADDLAPRDDSLGYGNLPEAYARICLMPLTSEKHCTQTEVAPPTQNPIWNANLSFPGVPGDELMERVLDVSLWDLIPHSEHAFLGECSIDLQKAFLDDLALWVRLEDPRQLRASGRSPHTSPRGSVAGGNSLRRGDFGLQRSQSDDVDSIGECASLLHPDHAWGPGSRRGSSQSEQLEVEVYQLGKDFSRSLPGSRRSSFQSGQEPEPIAEVPGENQVINILNPSGGLPTQQQQASQPPPMSYSRDRRRSSCTRMLRDPEEILRSLKAVKGELGRTMSLTGDKYKQHRRASAAQSSSNKRDSITDQHSQLNQSQTNLNSSNTTLNHQPSIHPHQLGPKLSNNVRLDTTPPSSPERTSPPRLGPGQIKPRGFKLTSTKPVELKLGLQMSKGQLELEVVQGRHINATSDTYVKCYLRDGERWLQKRKTRVVRHSAEPHFRQTLRYQACDVFGRSLVIMLWERQGGFEHNTGLGGCEIGLDSLTLTQLTTGWYPLFPIHSLGSDSNDSP